MLARSRALSVITLTHLCCIPCHVVHGFISSLYLYSICRLFTLPCSVFSFPLSRLSLFIFFRRVPLTFVSFPLLFLPASPAYLFDFQHLFTSQTNFFLSVPCLSSSNDSSSHLLHYSPLTTRCCISLLTILFVVSLLSFSE